jgi:MtN3 and saliva related transmembrane protein
LKGENKLPFGLSIGEWLGLAAGFLTTASFVPQFIRVYQMKSAREISLFFTIIFLVGVLVWVVYGLRFGHLPIILWNSITAIFIFCLLVAKVKYGKEEKKNKGG